MRLPGGWSSNSDTTAEKTAANNRTSATEIDSEHGVNKNAQDEVTSSSPTAGNRRGGNEPGRVEEEVTAEPGVASEENT